MLIFQKNLKRFNEIPTSAKYPTEGGVIPSGTDLKFEPFQPRPSTPIEYINLPFFKNWFVGFTNAEGSFFIKANNDGCYQIKQIKNKQHLELFHSFNLLLSTNRNIAIEKSPIYNEYCQYSVCSKKDVQNVINFFSFEGVHPLVGFKYIQY